MSAARSALPSGPAAAARRRRPAARCRPPLRDGLERIEVDGNANLAALKLAIQDKLGVPVAEQQLSKNPALVRPAAELRARRLGWWGGHAARPLPAEL